MTFTVEYEQEEDGRWLAEVKELPGVMVYGKNADDAMAHAQALALRVVADRLDNGESIPALMFSFSMAACWQDRLSVPMPSGQMMYGGLL
jgi:predicted RNase H-like HicB family nuclease